MDKIVFHPSFRLRVRVIIRMRGHVIHALIAMNCGVCFPEYTSWVSGMDGLEGEGEVIRKRYV